MNQIGFRRFFKLLKKKQKLVVVSLLMLTAVILLVIGLFPLGVGIANGYSIFDKNDSNGQFAFAFMGTGFTIFMSATVINRWKR